MVQQSPSSEPSSYAVELKTAAFLKDLQDQPDISSMPSTSPSVWTLLTQSFRAWKVVWSVVVVLALGINLLALSDGQAQSRGGNGQGTCGVDWLLRATGSSATFESLLGDKLEEARRDFDRQWAQSQSSSPAFDAGSLQWNPIDNGIPPARGRK